MTTEVEQRLLEVLERIEQRLAATAAAPTPVAAGPTLSIEEAAAQLGCSPRQVYKLLEDGKLKRGKKAGRKSRVLASSVRAYQGIKGDGLPAPSIGDRIRALGKK